MNWNEWEAIWKRQELPVGKNADVAKLLASYETKRRKQARTLWIRDITEAAASVLVAIAFSAIAIKTQRAAWLIWLAVVLVLGVGAMFVRERLRAKRVRLDTSAPLMAKLEANIAELRHQRRLLLNIGLWYFAPIAAAMLLVVTAMALNVSATSVQMLKHPFVLCFLIADVLLSGGLIVGASLLNRRAVRKQIEPRLEELEKLQHYMLNSQDSAS
jgi:hypothetical protein